MLPDKVLPDKVASPPPSAPAEDPKSQPTADAKAQQPNARGSSFEIIVLSTHDEFQSTLTALKVTGEDLPVRRQEVNGWIRVIAGPFPSRKEADAAHQRLRRPAWRWAVR